MAHFTPPGYHIPYRGKITNPIAGPVEIYARKGSDTNRTHTLGEVLDARRPSTGPPQVHGVAVEGVEPFP